MTTKDVTSCRTSPLCVRGAGANGRVARVLLFLECFFGMYRSIRLTWDVSVDQTDVIIACLGDYFSCVRVVGGGSHNTLLS